MIDHRFSFEGSEESKERPPQVPGDPSYTENPYQHTNQPQNLGEGVGPHETAEPQSQDSGMTPTTSNNAAGEDFHDAETHISGRAPSQSSRQSNTRSLRRLLSRKSSVQSGTASTRASRKEAEEEEERRKAEDPKHILETILEDSGSEHEGMGIDMGVQEAMAMVNSGTEGEQNHRTRGYKENLTRQRRLRRNARASNAVKSLRKVYDNFLSRTLITRWFVWWLPLALILFIPLAIGAWQNPNMRLGHTRVMWIFIWLEVAWAALAIGRVIAHYLPSILGVIVSVVAPRYFKLVDVVVALEIPVTLVIWTFVAFITFVPLISDNHDALNKESVQEMPRWQVIINDILVALLVSALVYFVEQVGIHFLSTSFHRTRMALRIRKQKKSVMVLMLLLDLSYTFFPFNCDEFAEEDTILAASAITQAQSRVNKVREKIRQFRVLDKLDNVGRVVNSAANAVNGLDPAVQPPLSRTVKNALASKHGQYTLANRIWKSLVLEDAESLTYEDLLDLLGRDRKEEVLYMFDILDSDGEGGIDLDEMIKSVQDIGLESRMISKSLMDIDGAITKLHHMLLVLILVLVVIIFVGMLAPSAATVLATLGSTLLALSWLFSATCAEVFNSCVFLFVKHPYDVGDWIQTSVPGLGGLIRMQVTELSLLYTVFSSVGDNIVRQASNATLNTLFLDNLSRSPPTQVAVTLVLGVPETKMSDIEELERRCNEFVEENPRELAPGPFIQITALGDLDRFTLTVCINLRNNRDDIVLYSQRQTKVHAFLLRCVHEIPLHVPRRTDTGYNDPSMPFYKVDLDTSAVQNPPKTGRRRAFGMLENPVIEEVPPTMHQDLTQNPAQTSAHEDNHYSEYLQRANSVRSRATGSEISVAAHGLRRTRQVQTAHTETHIDG